ncbi:MAG: cysteine desulfurase [Paramuribaculum sp.]|nr:cysteine desulfurase [Paramuribaculum sp.]MDE7237264.1 cysteine desulfurase [Paramuribaculum sp.]
MTDTLDVERLRSLFPILSRTVYGRPLVYLDNTASTQTPRPVVEAVTDMYYLHKANVHRGVHFLSQEATDMMEATRRMTAAFIGAPSTEEIIFTRGTTEAINLVASSYGELLHEGDEVVLTTMEHHANIVPWQLLRERRGIVIRVAPLLPDGSLDMDALRGLLNERTKVVSVAHVSNVLGTVNPVAEIAALAHAAGAVCVVDGAQAIAHIPVDVKAIGADFYVFSSHKMYGPCGVGVLYGRRELLEKMPPYQGGGEMISHVSFEHTTWAELPFKFEAGTPDYVDIGAFARAIEFLQETGLEAIAAHEEALLRHATARITAELPAVRIYGTAPGKAAIISFLLGDAHPYDTGMLLDKLGIACRTGHHCAQPLMTSLGIEGTVRASFAAYNTLAEADALVDGLHRIAPMLL